MSIIVSFRIESDETTLILTLLNASLSPQDEFHVIIMNFTSEASVDNNFTVIQHLRSLPIKIGLKVLSSFFVQVHR